MRRAQRLRRPHEFRRVRESGGRWGNRHFALTAAANRAGKTRAGFVVGKSLGGSVVRNRAKRRAREAVRLIFDHIVPGWDLVFGVRPAAVEAPFTELQESVAQLLRQAGLWRPEPLALGEQPPQQHVKERKP
jgi:ribonuclease P protein component